MSLRYASLCVLFKVAEASISIRSEDGGFQGDSLIKATLAFLCIYALLYLILTVSCVFVLVKKAGIRSGVYITLLLSLSFATISMVASVFNLVIQQNGIALPASQAAGHILLALAALINLFDFWSRPLLFLSICLLIRNRHSALQKARVSSAFPIGFYVLFALSMVFGTVAASLYLDYLSIIYLNRLINHTIEWLNHKVIVYLDLSYTFSSLWYLSAIFTLLYALFVHREMRRLSLIDKVLRIVLVGVAPAFILWAVEGMIFTILTSPSGIKVNPFDAIQVEAINFSSVFLANFFRTIMYGIMVGIGFSRELWYAEPADMIPLSG